MSIHQIPPATIRRHFSHKLNITRGCDVYDTGPVRVVEIRCETCNFKLLARSSWKSNRTGDY